MAKVLGIEFDPTPGFNIVSPSRWGKDGLVETTASHREHNAEKAVKANKETYTINGKTYNSAGQLVGEAPTGESGGDGGQATSGGTGLLSGGGVADPDAALRETLRREIMARGGDIDAVYASLFGELDNLVRSRDSELESQYGEQFKKAADTYAAALPEIENSYAAIGSADSTDQTDAKGKAKSGYEETTKTIGKNKEADKSKLGAYKREQEAKLSTDRDSAKRNVARAGETTDVDSLRSMRNDIEGNIDSAKVTKATLGTDGAARKEITNMTQDAGRYDAAVNALDGIIKSSMSGSVKEAAVKAIADNSGLSDEEKNKVNQMYGNTYAEQAAL